MLKFKIKNTKLAILGLLLICLFTKLGLWQLNRADEKRQLLRAYAERILHRPLTANELNNSNDRRFYRAQLIGQFDNQHTFLLDNKTAHGKIGYEVYTPFRADGMTSVILIDRGFINLGQNRQTLPNIRPIPGKATITGLLNLPPKYVALGRLVDAPTIAWPLRVEYVDLAQFAKLLSKPIFPYLLTMQPDDPRAYRTEWQVTLIKPERHLGYAVQWFALALTLLVLLLALNCSK